MRILDRAKGTNIKQLSEALRNIMLTHAMRMAELLFEYHHRFESCAISPLAIQQAALAASVLLTSITRTEGRGNIRDPALHYLESLQQFFTDVSQIQEPAERLARTMRQFMAATVDSSSRSSRSSSSTRRWQADAHRPSTIGLQPSETTRVADNSSIGETSIDSIWLSNDGQGGYREEQAAAERSGHDWRTPRQQVPTTVASDTNTGKNSDPSSLNSVMVGLNPTGHLEPRAEISPCASNANSTELFRTHSQSSSQHRNAMELGSTPSSHAGIAASLSHMRPSDLSLLPGELLLQQFPIGLGDLSLPESTETDHGELWGGDDAHVSWFETFKTLGAVNRRNGCEKANANEFGDVMGCVFKL